MKNWSEKTTIEKVMDIISGVALCVWAVLEYIVTKAPFSETASYVALCVICICEAVSFWNTQRVISYVAIGGMLLMVSALVLLAI